MLEIEKKLLEQGFNAVLIAKVIGNEDRVTYSNSFLEDLNTDQSFKEDYIDNQHIYNNKEYYHEYKVYSTEASLYCICLEKTRDLIGKGILI